ncbi:MAG TPA: hypothetical protein PLE39_06250 [Anaerolineales bacterium]|nr:hypothetical protein [Anaerolineales bacterium]HNE67962.1 hypothetical protein [Anaerolineales bacterium]
MMFLRFQIPAKKFLLTALTTLMLTSSCAVVDAMLTTPTPQIPTETPIPTATIVWFPPSATPSAQPFSTQLPTPEMRPGLGSIVLTDNFSNEEDWNTATSGQASAAIENNQLILASQSKVYMLSLRRDLALDDYYAEITARINLCRGDDSYGILVRANAVAYYRFALTCNSTVSAERVSVGTRQLLQSPLPSGDAPPGAPGEVRIGIWAVGTEMRLFLNGRYQFSISDTNYPSGTIGVFVNSAGDTGTVISFTELTVRQVNAALPAESSP